MKSIHKIFIALALFLVALIPTIYIIVLSINENSKYQVDSDYVFQEKGFGLPKLIEKKDFQSFIELEGTVDINSREVHSYDGSGTVLVEEGSEIYDGLAIAIINGKLIHADFNGILDRVDMGEKISFVVKPYKDYIFTVTLNEAFVKDIDKYKEATDIKENKYNLKTLYCSPMQENNQRKVIFSLSGKNLYPNKKLTLYVKDKLLKDAYFVRKSSVYYDSVLEDNAIQLLDEKQNIIDSTKVKIIGEDYNDYAIEYDDSKGKYVDESYGLFKNNELKKSQDNDESGDDYE